MPVSTRDRAQGAVSFTPIVVLPEGTDADAGIIETIHHDINNSLGGEMIHIKDDANEKWFYTTSKIVTTTSADLISGDFTEGGTIATSDDVRFLFVKHSGTTDGTTATASNAYVYLNLADGNASSATDVIAIAPGEAFQCKLKYSTGVEVGELHAATQSGTSDVLVTIAAIIDDGG